MEYVGPLVRFAVKSGKITDEVVKPKLFEPNRNVEVSVSRTQGLERSDIIEIGIDVVHRHKTAKALYGWAMLTTALVVANGLTLQHDNDPPLHSQILGWPRDPEVRKALQIDIASKLQPTKLSEKNPSNVE